MKMKSIGRFSAVILSFLLFDTAAAQGPAAATPQKQPTPVKVDSETISGLGARNIGSAAMSGRVAALDAVQEGQRLTIYIGAASGACGIVNGGATFKPVFDNSPSSPSRDHDGPEEPKVVWVGAGEPWTATAFRGRRRLQVC